MATATFDVPTGPCAGSFDRVVVSTDLEPDDAVALYALAPRLRGVPLLVILGEGPINKCQMAAGLFARLGLHEHAKFVQGRKSKSAWPDVVTGCYAGLEPPTSAAYGEGEEAVSAELSAFVSTATAPFALLLKPPHEFLTLAEEQRKRCVAALYGSFNLAELREGITKGDASLTADDAYERQQGLMASFAALLWVERSLSVGRDSVLEPKSSGKCWAAISTCEPLMKHILQWNAVTINAIAKKLGGLEVDVAKALGGGPDSGEGSDLGDKQYLDVAALAERAEKRVAILKSIADASGRQVCHADTLVIACLMDGAGVLAPYSHRSSPGRDAIGKPIAIPEAGSTVHALLAKGGDERAALERLSIEVLGAALASNLAG